MNFSEDSTSFERQTKHYSSYPKIGPMEVVTSDKIISIFDHLFAVLSDMH
jgi:hypothetical protein